ncbi:MAG: HNH endonuclease [Candidatus Binatia bacterium]
MASSASRLPAFEEFDLVDPDILRPPDTAIRGSWRTDAAVVLDRELVALAGVEARCRLLRARIARRMMRIRAWRFLGFVRLADFARERLGLSPRSLEDDARVLDALDGLPRLSAALESGALTWTRVRALVRVATPANEVALLQASLAVSLRELDDFVATFAARGRAGPAPADGAHATDSAELDAAAAPGPRAAPTAAPDDDDPLVPWSITISRSGRRIWYSACEYASRSEGSVLSTAAVLERMAAEAASGAPVPGDGAAASGDGAAASDGASAASDDVTAASDDASAASPGRAPDSPPRWRPPPEAHERRFRSLLAAREQRGRRFLMGFLAETGVAEGFPWLEPASLSPGPAAALDALVEGLDAADSFELERRLQHLRRITQRIDAQMAALLRTSIDRRLLRELGFATVKLYVESRLGCSARKVWNLVAIERESWRRSRLLHHAWHDGRLTSLQAAALLPVLRENNAEAWIRRAGEVTLRRLGDEVAWALDHEGRDRSTSTSPLPPAEGTDVRADTAGDVFDAEVQNRAHGAAADACLGPPGTVRIQCSLPLSVAVLLESTLDRLYKPGEARWQTFERMAALALLEWKGAPRHRDPIFERDGWRCSVPACSSRRNLHDHHVLFRARGGGNAQGNRVSVCADHHLHGIHEGIVRARGQAPDAVVWELGCARGRPPLATLLGDRYM